MSPIKQTHPPPSPCAHVGLCRHCACGSSSSSSYSTSSPSPSCSSPLSVCGHPPLLHPSHTSHPIEHMWSSTITTPLAHLPYLFTHSPTPALTFLTYPCKTTSLMQGGQRPSLHPPCPPGHVCTVGCAIHALCVLTPCPPQSALASHSSLFLY